MSARDSSATTRLRLRVRVVPGARTSGVVGRLGDAWKLRVKAPPERGRANGELVALLARTLDVPRAAVRVARGHTTGEKLVEVDRLTREDADRRLAAAQEGRA
jgi:uncharacterized protein YggU (UPF0235/DUF167 family)